MNCLDFHGPFSTEVGSISRTVWGPVVSEKTPKNPAVRSPRTYTCWVQAGRCGMYSTMVAQDSLTLYAYVNVCNHMRILRKAVRQPDSLLFATEGRIGGLGAEPRFRQENLALPLGRGWSREAVLRVMYRVAIW